MKLTVIPADPAGNRTLLVTTPVSLRSYGAVAAALLQDPALRGEQVGFLTPPQGDGDVRLAMMGGEFCGNALRCAGLVFAASHGPARQVSVECTGCSHPLTVDADPAAGTAFAQMPLPLSYETIHLLGTEGTAVCFEGIVHAVLPWSGPLPEVQGEIQRLAKTFSAAAAGILFYDRAASFLRPAVYVRATDTLYFESSCASGSTAVACWEALHGGSLQLSLRQPGGVIETHCAVADGCVTGVRLGGAVTLEPERIVTVSLRRRREETISVHSSGGNNGT